MITCDCGVVWPQCSTPEELAEQTNSADTIESSVPWDLHERVRIRWKEHDSRATTGLDQSRILSIGELRRAALIARSCAALAP